MLILEKEIFDTYYTSLLYGLVLIMIGIIYSIRYAIFNPALILGFAGITLWHYILAARYDTFVNMVRVAGVNVSSFPAEYPYSMWIWMINLLIFVIILSVYGPTAIKAFRIEQLARKIFKMAAGNVVSTGDGFTSRPFHAGTKEYTKEQITGFSLYISGKMIAVPRYTETGIRLSFSMVKSPLSKAANPDISYVQFDYNQHITIHIASGDYKRFRNQLTFDQLCESMGDLFKRFLNYYINNQEARILNELKSI